MTREELLMILSRLGPQDINQLRKILSEQELGQDTGTGDMSEIGFDVTRTKVINNNEK